MVLPTHKVNSPAGVYLLKMIEDAPRPCVLSHAAFLMVLKSVGWAWIFSTHLLVPVKHSWRWENPGWGSPEVPGPGNLWSQGNWVWVLVATRPRLATLKSSPQHMASGKWSRRWLPQFRASQPEEPGGVCFLGWTPHPASCGNNAVVVITGNAAWGTVRGDPRGRMWCSGTSTAPMSRQAPRMRAE